jgi:PIN domain nuclease of toxin-antitoxin system
LLPIEARHVQPLTALPFHHNNPFDRLIAATSLIESMRLVSPDAILDAYEVTRLW